MVFSHGWCSVVQISWCFNLPQKRRHWHKEYQLNLLLTTPPCNSALQWSISNYQSISWLAINKINETISLMNKLLQLFFNQTWQIFSPCQLTVYIWALDCKSNIADTIVWMTLFQHCWTFSKVNNLARKKQMFRSLEWTNSCCLKPKC